MVSLFRSTAVAVTLAAAALMHGGLAQAADADNASRSGGKLVGARAAAVSGYFAVVNANGTLARGKGVVSTRRLDAGDYEVIFRNSIAGCAFTASIGNTGFVGTATPGEITVQGRFNTNNGVFVNTMASSGSPDQDRPFHVVVTC